MPNYVRNRLTINASVEDCKKVMNTILNEEDILDFNKIIPMPEDLNISDSSNGELGMCYVKGTLTDWEKRDLKNFRPKEKKRLLS